MVCGTAEMGHIQCVIKNNFWFSEINLVKYWFYVVILAISSMVQMK